MTNGHDTPIAIYVPLLASNHMVGDKMRHESRSDTAAGPFFAAGVGAGLLLLRRVYAVNAYALAVDLDCVAVRHGGGASDIGKGGCGQ
jgi:hypothetical protein